jgi:antitoxin VapB
MMAILPPGANFWNVKLTTTCLWHRLWHMPNERYVRLFRNGRNQALRIPREWELQGDEAIIHREGDRLIIEPVRKGGLLSLLDRLQPIDEPFPDVDEALPALDDVTF